MTTITCDTTPAADGTIHAVIFRPVGLTLLGSELDIDVGDTITLIDQTTGLETTGTLTDYEASIDTPDQPGYGLRALRVELTITPS